MPCSISSPHKVRRSSQPHQTALPGVPPALIAAARVGAPRPGGEPVLITTPDGHEAIAVIGDEGDPAVRD